jgi:hypothetical protein
VRASLRAHSGTLGQLSVVSPEITVQGVELGLPRPDDLRALWAEDRGAVREVYVENTTTADWDAVVAAIQER